MEVIFISKDKIEFYLEIFGLSLYPIDILEVTIMLLPVENIIPDPWNMEIYTMDDVFELAERISEKGFFGEIVVYPVGENKYRIESGHRRYEAVCMCGIKEIPVTISKPPATEIERRERLIRWNLHNRKLTPMTLARSMQFQYDTYEMQNEELKKTGKKTEPILPKLAKDFDCSESSIKKYRMLINLIPELQELADSGDYSWSVIGKAAVLSEQQQKMLYMRIKGKTRLMGPAAATSAWIENERKSYGAVINSGKDDSAKYSYMDYINSQKWQPQPAKEKTEKPKKETEKGSSGRPEHGCLSKNKTLKRHRRCDTAKLISNSRQYLEKAVDEDNLLKIEDSWKTLNNLRDMKDMIDKMIERIENT